MPVATILELVAAAVLLMAVGAILAVHGLGLLDYRPSPSEVRP